MEIKLTDGTVADLDLFDGYRINNGKLIFIPKDQQVDYMSDFFKKTPLYKSITKMLKKS